MATIPSSLFSVFASSTHSQNELASSSLLACSCRPYSNICRQIPLNLSRNVNCVKGIIRYTKTKIITVENRKKGIKADRLKKNILYLWLSFISLANRSGLIWIHTVCMWVKINLLLKVCRANYLLFPTNSINSLMQEHNVKFYLSCDINIILKSHFWWENTKDLYYVSNLLIFFLCFSQYKPSILLWDIYMQTVQTQTRRR